jgi:hypothetical protein
VNNKPVRRKGVVCKQLDETETMLYDPETEAIHILNPTARLIWELCDGKHTVADMIAATKSQFTGTDDSDISDHVHRTLDTFATQGLLAING